MGGGGEGSKEARERHSRTHSLTSSAEKPNHDRKGKQTLGSRGFVRLRGG